MKFLRSVAVVGLLLFALRSSGEGGPLHAQAKEPSASESSAAIVNGGVAIYATLNNPTMYDAYVQSGTSDGGKVELREGDKTTTNITIPSFGSVELKAGGPFVLVTDLKSQPKAGDTIKVTLNTDGGVAIAIAAVVKVGQ
jgi:copper(I)-binding protein